MKNLILVLCLILSFQSVAQTIDGSDSLDSTFSETTKMTDQQADEAATFVHQGLKDKAIEKGCDNKTLKGCDGSSAKPGLEDQIGKMYAVLFGLGPMLMKKSGGGSSNAGGEAAQAPANTPANATAPAGTTNGQAPRADAKKKSDYCIYIPMAYEGLSFLIQSSGQKQAQQESANLDPQLASLVQLKEAHKTRKKTATQQSVVYGVTGACYAAMLMMGKVDGGPMTFVKMGAAGALSMLFMSKAKKHGKAAEMVQAVIDGLPKAGDCNPWTGTSCFCSEKTSVKLYPGQYQEVCVLNKGNPNGGLANDGCAVQVNGKVGLDTSCGCKKTNSCLSSKISFGKSTLGLGANFVNDANKGLALLDPSQFDSAKLSDFQSSMAAKLGKVPGKDIPDVKLTPAQRALADEMSKVAPASIAAFAAASPSASPPVGGIMGGGTASALDNLPASLKKDLKDFEVSGGYRGNGGFSPTSASGEQGFSIPGMGGQQEPQGGVQVEEYAAKAMDTADVRNSPDVAIFDIISNRYRSSAWKRLDTTEGK
jgi:hypothetical protein